MSSERVIDVCPAVEIVIGTTKLDLNLVYEAMIHDSGDIEPEHGTTRTDITTAYTDVQKPRMNHHNNNNTNVSTISLL